MNTVPTTTEQLSEAGGLAEFWPNGPSTSGLFDLPRPVQYLFQCRGNVAVPRFSRARTMLFNHSAGRSYELAAAEIGFGLADRFPFVTCGSLLLAPGRYSWFSEVLPIPFDQVASCFLRMSVSNSPEPIETRGLRDVASLMSGAAGTKIFARASVDAAIGDSEPFSAQIIVTNLMTNEQIATPMLNGIGPTGGEVEIGVVPYFLINGQIFRTSFKVNYSGSGVVHTVLRQAYE